MGNPKLDLKALEGKLDNALSKETSETLNNWIENKRSKSMKDLEKLKRDFIVWKVRNAIKKVNKKLGTNYQLQTIEIETKKNNYETFKKNIQT